MLALFAFTGLSLVLQGSGPGLDSPAARAAGGREVEELKVKAVTMSATQIRRIAPTDALAINAAIPVSHGANPAARPFLLAAASEADRLRSIALRRPSITRRRASRSTASAPSLRSF